MKRSDIKRMPEYFDRYINQVDDIELDAAFAKNLETVNDDWLKALEPIANRSYAPGKWTIKDVIQHVIDSERVFAYRALRFARQDGVTPQGYDQEVFARNANAGDRSLEDLLDEMKVLHLSTRMMFRSFGNDILPVTGICWNQETSVLAMGFTITGHFVHHLRIIEERYIPSGGGLRVDS